MSLTYVANPYSHPDPAVRQQRYEEVCRFTAERMAAGEVCFSPIAHSHPIEVVGGLVRDGDFWEKQDAPYLNACDKLVVLMLDGWMSSKGVAHEIKVAKERGIPVEYVSA